MEPRNSREVAVPAPRQTLGTRRTAMRMMHRASQGLVAVYEQDPTANEAGNRTLVFESLVSNTRVENFPADWHRLTDDELNELRRGLRQQ